MPEEQRATAALPTRGLIVGAAILFIVVIALGIFVWPSTPTEKKDFVQAIGIVLAGFVGVAGLLLPLGGEAPPLILCESRSLAGVLSPIAAEYLCPIATTN